jgi:3-oxoacyl-[acyl-carrier-protein] synthase II
MKHMTRVVVTAAGISSPIGIGLEEFTCGLYKGTTATAPSSRFASAVTAEIADFRPEKWLGNKGIRVLDRSARLLAVAAHLALQAPSTLQEANDTGDPELGLVCGTMFGCVHSITAFDWSGITEGPNLVNPMDFPNTVINSPAGQAAIKHKLRGVNSTVCAGLASGLYALQYAAEFLRFGRARALLAGGVEELCEESVLGFRKTGVASPSGFPRPFGASRDGAVPGEAAAIWMLETEETALQKGRTPRLELCGFGCAHDARNISCFDVRGRGATDAIEQALENSGIGPDRIACVVASASGSRAGDEMEARALQNVLGPRLREIPVCAPKATFGEAMGASGAACAIVAGIALENRCVPPTAGFESSDYDLRLSAKSTPISGDYALVNAFGCDGNNASMVIRRWTN